MMPELQIDKEFQNILQDCLRRIEAMEHKWGDTWKTATIEFLRKRLSDEYTEWMDEQLRLNKSMDDERAELVDVINQAMFLAVRLKNHPHYRLPFKK